MITDTSDTILMENRRYGVAAKLLLYGDAKTMAVGFPYDPDRAIYMVI